jgi:glycosyltransferase involved in cell wall biosynthesis
MKLIIFSPSLNAYSETFIHNHIKYLPFDKVILCGTDISSLTHNNIPLLSNNYLNRIRKKIFKVIFKKDSNYLNEKKLIEFLKKNKPDIILFEYGHIGALLHKYCCELNIPFIVHFHGNDASHIPTLTKLKKEYLDMFKHAKGIIAVSNSMVDRLYQLGAPSKKVFFNCYGVDIVLFHERVIIPEQITFLAVGRFVEKKAQQITLLAFNHFVKRIPNAKLRFIGDGELINSCKQLVTALNLEKKVEFLGIQTPNIIAQNMQEATAFLQHSVIGVDGSAEGTPLAILEALAVGIPVISTRHEGIQDIIKDGHNGFLVDEFDWMGMARAMELVAEDKLLQTQLGRNARKLVLDKYNLESHIDKLADFIRNSEIGQ